MNERYEARWTFGAWQVWDIDNSRPAAESLGLDEDLIYDSEGQAERTAKLMNLSAHIA